MTTHPPPLPSIRDLAQRLGRMSDTAALVRELESLDTSLKLEAGHAGAYGLVLRVATRAADLHQLATQLLRYVRNQGTPPAPPPPAPREPAVSMHAPPPAPPPGRAIPRAKRAPPAVHPLPPGRIGISDVLALMGLSRGALELRIRTGRFPRGLRGTGAGNPLHWCADEVAQAVAAEQPQPHEMDMPACCRAAGGVTSQRLYQLMATGRWPRPVRHAGRRPVWRADEVHAAVQALQAVTDARVPTKLARAAGVAGSPPAAVGSQLERGLGPP